MLAVLLIATVLWGVLFFFSLQNYNEYVKDYDEECEEARRKGREHGLIVDCWIAEPYREWDNGGVILLFGFALLCVWITIFLKRKSLRG
jgi:hypothetical protein